MSPSGSLALALTYVAQELGITADREILEAAEPTWDILYDAVVVDVGQYGTYPESGPAVMLFDNGLYYYVHNCVDHKIINTDYNVVDMALYGTPVAWARYEIFVPTPEPMVYRQNTVDDIEYTSFGTPKKMYIVKPQGASMTNFGGKIDTRRDFVSVPGVSKSLGDPVLVMGLAHHPVKPFGRDFYITTEDWGSFTNTGHIDTLRGYDASDLSDVKPIPAPKAVITPKTLKIDDVIRIKEPEQVVEMAPKPENMGFRWLNDEHTAVQYQIMRPVVAMNYILPQSQWPKTKVVFHKPTIVAAYGTFPVNKRLMYLLKTDGSDIFDYWYGVPEVDREGNRLIEEMPDLSELRAVELEQVNRRYGMSTYVFDLASKLEVYAKHRIFKVKRK